MSFRKSAAAFLSTSIFLAYALMPQTAYATVPSAKNCATPGKDGAPAGISGVLNSYFPVAASVAAGSTTINVGTINAGGATTAFSVGDLALIIQMQSGAITSTNSAAYGSNTTSGSGYTSLGSAGLYEYVKIISATATSITISGLGAGNGLINSYNTVAANGTTVGQQKFQVVRVPQYTSPTLSGAITAAPWNGSSGGIIAIDASVNLQFNGQAISATGKGFRGGGVKVARGQTGGANTDYVNASTRLYHGSKGEGISGTPNYVYNGTAVSLTTTPEGYPNGSMGRGAPGNAGGGGTDANPAANDQNSGGGGGGNGGAGGVGGKSWSSALPIGGLGGTGLPASASRLFMGGGGGAGSNNDGTNAPNGSSGGVGGGMVFIRVYSGSGSGTIAARGSDGVAPANDGGGGGGSGGTISVSSVASVGAGVSLNATGGNGSNANIASTGAANDHGPGGGGGGGVDIVSTSSGVSATQNQGLSGITSDGTKFGATDGSTGTTISIHTIDIPGIASGGECVSDPAAFVIGPALNSTAIGSYDGAVLASNNNDFTAVNIAPAGTTITTNATGTGAPVTTIVSNTSPCIKHTFSNFFSGTQSFSIDATAPTGMLVGLYSDSTCATLLPGSTVSAHVAAVVASSLVNSGSGSVYAKYTATTAKTFTPYIPIDASIFFYLTGSPIIRNFTHDELYFGFVSVTKSTIVLSSPCNAGTSNSGACPKSVIQYALNYKNTILGGASESTLVPLPFATASNFVLSDDGNANGNTWFTNSLIGLNSAPVDSTAGTTYTYTGTLGTNASKFNATIGGLGLKLVPVGVTGTGTASSGVLKFNVTIK